MTDRTDKRGGFPSPELVARVRAGDETAFADLVRRYRGLVFAVCSRQARGFDDAEDLTQEVFLAAHRGLAALREPEKLAAWLQGIALNQCRTAISRGRPAPAVVPWPDTLSRETYRLELRHLLGEALQGVSERNREVLALHYLHGHSYREIGALCRLPLRTVRSRLHEGRRQLRRRLLATVAELCRGSRDPEHTSRCAVEQCGREPCACVARLTAD